MAWVSTVSCSGIQLASLLLHTYLHAYLLQEEPEQYAIDKQGVGGLDQ